MATIFEEVPDRLRTPAETVGNAGDGGENGGRSAIRAPGADGIDWGSATEPLIGPGAIQEGAIDNPAQIAPGVIEDTIFDASNPVDPAGYYRVGRFELSHASSNGEAANLDTREYQVQGKLELLDDWETLAGTDGTYTPGPTSTHTLDELVSVRYLRLYVLEPTDPASLDDKARIYRFAAFNALAGGTDLNLAVAGEVADTEDGANLAGFAADGSGTTKWQSTNVVRTPHWVEYDLGTLPVMTLATGADADNSWIDVSWPLFPNVNSVQISYRPTADPVSSARTQRLPVEQLSVRLRNLLPNTGYTIELRTINGWERYSDPAADTITTAKDTGAPAQVAGLIITKAIKTALASWTDSAATDLQHYELEVYSDAGLTSLVFSWKGRATIVSVPVAPGDNRWARVRAVDRSLNAGAWSTTASTTADATVGTTEIALLAVDTARIADLAVATAKIANLAVTTAKIDDLAVSTAKIGSLQVTDAKIAALDAAKITTGFLDAGRIDANTITADMMQDRSYSEQMEDGGFEDSATRAGAPANWSGDNTVAGRIGSWAMKWAAPAPSGSSTSWLLKSDVACKPGQQWYGSVRARITTPAGFGAGESITGVNLNFVWKDDTGTPTGGAGGSYATGTTGPNDDTGWNDLGLNSFVPADAVTFDVYLEASHAGGSVAGGLVWFDEVQVRRQFQFYNYNDGDQLRLDGDGLFYWNGDADTGGDPELFLPVGSDAGWGAAWNGIARGMSSSKYVDQVTGTTITSTINAWVDVIVSPTYFFEAGRVYLLMFHCFSWIIGANWDDADRWSVEMQVDEGETGTWVSVCDIRLMPPADVANASNGLSYRGQGFQLIQPWATMTFDGSKFKIRATRIAGGGGENMIVDAGAQPNQQWLYAIDVGTTSIAYP